MSDQCLKCNHFNRPDMCVGEDCSIKESWYVLYLTQQIASLQERERVLIGRLRSYGDVETYREEALRGKKEGLPDRA